ncbi:MAG: transcription termination/antitermination protein NusG [Negativicutes bacterium]|nr:transcription termination/antitermination protein NusG [Negativicutes bacterium]
MDSEKKWYVIHTYSGYENKVKANIEKKINSLGLENKIFRILVPTEEMIEFKDGRRKKVQKKIFPGYVLVEMIVDDNSWYTVRNTPGVTGFVGAGTKPTPLTLEEIKHIMRTMGEDDERIQLDVGLNELVRIMSGAFTGLTARVVEISHERRKVKVLVNMFGRDTPLELDFAQVEKA